MTETPDPTTTPPTALQQTISDYVAAGFAGLYVTTFEPQEAIREIRAACVGPHRAWTFAVWDVAAGLEMNGQPAPDTTDPLALLQALPALSAAARFHGPSKPAEVN